MKKSKLKIILFSIAIVLLIPIISIVFLIAKDNGIKYGYIDKNGNTIIKPQFDKAGDFNEGLAYACIHKKCGYIDKTGNWAIQPIFDDTNNYSQGLAGVMVKNTCFYIEKSTSKKNKQIKNKETTIRIGINIIPSAAYVGEFSEGLAHIVIKDGANVKDCYINKNGKIVIKRPAYKFGPDFFNNTAAYKFIDGMEAIKINRKYGFMNNTGKVVILPRYDNITRFAEGLASVKINKKWGYIDKTGKFIIQPIFDDASLFNEGLAPVMVNNKLGYINKKGEIFIKSQFDGDNYPSNGIFYEGIALVKLNKKFGYINKKGEMIIRPQFVDGDRFSEGLAKVGKENY